MKTLFYMGLNPRTLSGVSWKIWKIQRKGKYVQAWWGPAHVVRRKVVPKSTLQTAQWTFRSEDAARKEEHRRVADKLCEGYETKPTRR
jgi:hypothetical protein